MAQGNPLPGEQYLHFKNKLYQIVSVAYHSETMERYVVYQALYGDFKTYIRPYDMFISEVDHEKYPDAGQKYRFQYLGNVADARNPEKSEEQTVPMERDTGAAHDMERTETAKVKQKKEENENRNRKESVNEIPVETADAGEKEESTEGVINPWLDKILDAESFAEKYKIVCDMQTDVTDRLIDDIAVVMDLAIPEGNLRERYAQLKYCIRTRQKYENGRLR